MHWGERWDSNPLGLASQASASTTLAVEHHWSNMRDSNPRTPAWKAETQPLCQCCIGTTYGSRTRVGWLRANYPRPLDESDMEPSLRLELRTSFLPRTCTAFVLRRHGAKPRTRTVNLRFTKALHYHCASKAWWGRQDSNLHSPKAAVLQTGDLPNLPSAPLAEVQGLEP